MFPCLNTYESNSSLWTLNIVYCQPIRVLQSVYMLTVSFACCCWKSVFVLWLICCCMCVVPPQCLHRRLALIHHLKMHMNNLLNQWSKYWELFLIFFTLYFMTVNLECIYDLYLIMICCTQKYVSDKVKTPDTEVRNHNVLTSPEVSCVCALLDVMSASSVHDSSYVLNKSVSFMSLCLRCTDGLSRSTCCAIALCCSAVFRNRAAVTCCWRLSSPVYISYI